MTEPGPLALTSALARLAAEHAVVLGVSGEPPLFHFMHDRAHEIALCGNYASRSSEPVTRWGVETERGERWCLQCAAEAAELLSEGP